jgi:hypothetical protein
MILTLPTDYLRRRAATWPALKAALDSASTTTGAFTTIQWPTTPPPPEQFLGRPNSEPGTRNPEPGTETAALGDRLAALLRRLGLARAGECGCARRQAWLNRQGARLKSLLAR